MKLAIEISGIDHVMYNKIVAYTENKKGRGHLAHQQKGINNGGDIPYLSIEDVNGSQADYSFKIVFTEAEFDDKGIGQRQTLSELAAILTEIMG